MTTPRITRTGNLRAHGRDVEVIGDGCLSISLDAAPDDTEDARAMHETRVRVTIELASPMREALTIEQIKTRLRDALPDYRRHGYTPSPTDITTDLAAEVAKMIEEARS